MSEQVLRELVEQWREREKRLLREADRLGQSQYAHRISAEAEGIARCADQLENVLVSSLTARP